jgi:shikimate kinase
MNVVLVGMPGSGKSTIGVLLAKALGKEFVDTDLLIQKDQEMLLQEIIDKYGNDRFLDIEDEVVCDFDGDDCVIATGGSVIYSETAISKLKEKGTVIYLQLDYEEIETRLDNLASRGVTMKEGQTLLDLYNERTPLYDKRCDVVMDCNGRSMEETVQDIMCVLEYKNKLQKK